MLGDILAGCSLIYSRCGTSVDSNARLDLQTFGIHEGCGVYATLQRHELAEFLPQVQESFGLGFHVLEDADEAAAELALDVRIADLFAGEEMGAIQQELLLQCEMDSDDEVIEQRAGTMNEVRLHVRQTTFLWRFCLQHARECCVSTLPCTGR